MKTGLIAMTAALLMAAHPAYAKDLVFTSWGGTTQDAQKAAWADPYTAAGGLAVVQDGPTDYGKLQAMVEANAVTWDVVDVEYDYGLQAAAKGLLEPLDFSIIDKSKLDPRFVSDYQSAASISLSCSATTRQLHGRTAEDAGRSLRHGEVPGQAHVLQVVGARVIEAALVADGVAPDKLYPLDLDRAFKKLDTIKKDIVWWSSGAQSQQLLASGEAPIGFFWNGRLAALAADGAPVGIAWDQNITAADGLVVPKGSANKEAAMKFIAYATSAKGQADFAAASGYAPINTESAALMDPAVRATLPDAQTAPQINADMKYWAEHRDEIGSRWYAWQAE